MALTSFSSLLFFFFFFFLPLLLSPYCSAASSSTHRIPGHHHHQQYQHGHGRVPTSGSSSSSPSPSAACKTTPYPQLCSRILSSSSPSTPLNRQIAVVSSFALGLTNTTYHMALHVSRLTPHSAPAAYSGALQDCIDLMGNSMDQLRLSISRLSHLNPAGSTMRELRAQVMDAQVALSASFTFQDTCSDELRQHDTTPATAQLLTKGGDITRAVNVALALAATLQHRVSP